MKKILLFAILVVSLTASAATLVEPGRTWWYLNWTTSIPRGESVIIGLTLGEADEISEGWCPCYAMDSLKNRIVDAPLAHLKEESGVVSIRPNLGLMQYDEGEQSNELRMLSLFLGYWGGNELEEYKRADLENDYIWNPDSITEFTLYDFNSKIGDAFSWPWSGKDLDVPDKKPHIGDLKLISIDEESISLADDGERIARVFNLKQDNYPEWSYGNNCNARIIDGIGIVSGNFWSYIEALESWYGFFIAPNSILGPAIAGGFKSPTIPVLYSVEDADGKSLYIDPEYYEFAGTAKIEMSSDKMDGKTYDLHGREVTNPVPGSIYIRNGKKFVAE